MHSIRRALFAVGLILLAPSAGFSQPQFEFGPLRDLLTDEGRMSFGTIVSADVVAWSAPDAKDLLIARLWDGVYLYPSRDLETIGEPIKLCDQLGHVVLMVEPIDADGDGRPEVVGTDRQGKIFLMQLIGEYPNLRLEAVQDPLVTDDGLPFNIPFVNPKYRLADDPSSLWPMDFNYTYPTLYAPADEHPASLIIGDWGGELWYLPHVDNEDGLPVFAGEEYEKRDGRVFAQPKFLLKDENGNVLLMGEGKEGETRYPGGASRPVMYRNASTQSDDLIVLCGMTANEMRYLQRVKTGDGGEPIFRDIGEMTIEALPDEGYDAYNYHAVLALVGDGDDPDLLISRGSDIAVCRNLKKPGPMPAFRFSRWISGKDAPTRGYNFTEILTDHRGRRFLLDNDNTWMFRELFVVDGEPRISSERFPLYDQHGVFKADGATDSQHGKNWGFHRAALWDYDGSSKQHLIVGTDGGLLFVLVNEKPLGEEGRFEFRSIGPLKDTNGDVIRVHHRVVAAPIDLDADGDLDLVLVGATYGPGDPKPGSGIYYSINEGVHDDGTPMLSPVERLPTVGHEHPDFTNLHGQAQALDLLGTGEQVVAIGTQRGDNFRTYVYRPAKDRIALEHTGIILPTISIEERLLDLDGDSDWEYLRSGGESLIAKFAEVMVK